MILGRDINIGLVGEKYGLLTIIEEAEPTTTGIRRVLCRCDCGNERICNVYELHDGEITCCKECVNKKRINNSIEKYKYMIGQLYGRLTVQDIYYDINKKKILAHCICSCVNNTEYDIEPNKLLNGNTKSCGCYKYESMFRQRKVNEYDLTNEYGIGFFDNGEKFYFDLEDYDLIRKYHWTMMTVRGTRYAVTKRKIQDKYVAILMHRLIMGALDNQDVEVDHIKHNTLDNRKSQLRIGTKWDNNLNHDIFVTNTSGCTGVQWDKKNNKWFATITYNKTPYWLGYYINKEDAIKARKLAENYYFKEWSFDNSMNAELSEDSIM